MSQHVIQPRELLWISGVALALQPLLLLVFLHSLGIPRFPMPADEGMPSSDSAKDIRHLLKMQNIPSESEKGGRRGEEAMPRILIASTLYETFRQALYSPSRASDFFPFFFSPLLGLSYSISRIV